MHFIFCYLTEECGNNGGNFTSDSSTREECLSKSKTSSPESHRRDRFNPNQRASCMSKINPFKIEYPVYYNTEMGYLCIYKRAQVSSIGARFRLSYPYIHIPSLIIRTALTLGTTQFTLGITAPSSSDIKVFKRARKT